MPGHNAVSTPSRSHQTPHPSAAQCSKTRSGTYADHLSEHAVLQSAGAAIYGLSISTLPSSIVISNVQPYTGGPNGYMGFAASERCNFVEGSARSSIRPFELVRPRIEHFHINVSLPNRPKTALLPSSGKVPGESLVLAATGGSSPQSQFLGSARSSVFLPS
jgi:hypothetical protein